MDLLASLKDLVHRAEQTYPQGMTPKEDGFIVRIAYNRKMSEDDIIALLNSTDIIRRALTDTFPGSSVSVTVGRAPSAPSSPASPDPSS